MPLHSNAASMVTGAPGRALINRIKVLSLLFDELVLEDGSFEFTLGEQAGIEGPSSSDSWTTPSERATQRRRNSEMVVTTSEGSEKSRHSMNDAHYWRATMRPVLADMGRAFDWVSLASVALTDSGKYVAGLQLRDALGLGDEPPSVSVRDGVLFTETAQDLVAAAALESVVSMDQLHGRYVAALVDANLAAPVSGALALWVACPEVTGLTWSDIDSARGRRGMDELRALLAEVEAEAVEAATAHSVQHEINQRLLQRVLDTAHSSRLAVWLGAGKRAAIATVIGATPAGIPYSVGAELAGAWRRSGSWLAALTELRSDAKGRAALAETKPSARPAGRPRQSS